MTEKTKDRTYEVDWTLYDYFYNTEKKHCRDTNFVEQILLSTSILAKLREQNLQKYPKR